MLAGEQPLATDPRREGVAALIVALVFVACLATTMGYIVTYASAIPLSDDYTIVRMLTQGGVTEWLWALHNEHRCPLPKLLLWAIVAPTHSLRLAMLCHATLLALPPLGMVWVARRLRGTVSIADAFFPLIWLQLGNYFNLLTAFDVVMAVSASLRAGLFLLLISQATSRWSIGRCALIGICLIGLPLSGGAGVLWLVVPALCLAVVALRQGARTPATGVLIVSVLAALGVLGAYLAGYEAPEGHTERGSPLEVALTASRFLSMGMGGSSKGHWVWIAGVLLVLLPAVVLGLRSSLPGKRAWILVFLAADLCLALGIGWGRAGNGPSAGLAERYVTLVLPFLSTLFLAAVLVRPTWLSRGVQLVLLGGCLALVPENLDRALTYGRKRREVSQVVYAEVSQQWSPQQVAFRHARNLEGGRRPALAAMFEGMREIRFAPYDRVDDGGASGPAVKPPYSMFGAEPLEVTSSEKTRVSRLGLLPVLLVHADGTLRFDVPADATTVEGTCGLHPIALASGRCDGIVLSAEVRTGDAQDGHAWQPLFRVVLEPGEKRKGAFRHPLPEGATEVVFRVGNQAGRTTEMDWSFWTGIRFR